MNALNAFSDLLWALREQELKVVKLENKAMDKQLRFLKSRCPDENIPAMMIAFNEAKRQTNKKLEIESSIRELIRTVKGLNRRQDVEFPAGHKRKK